MFPSHDQLRVGISGLSNQTLDLGQRVLGGTFAVSPHSMGSHLALYADLYEEHEYKHMKVRYVPGVPATEIGSVAVYFRNDIGTPSTTIGRAEFAHASTHPSFVSTPIYQAVEMEIHPEDINLSYFDETTGDFRLETQGLVVTLAASQIDQPTNVTTTIGNLYVEYMVEFRGAETEYDIVEVQQFEAAIRIQQGTTVVTERANVQFQMAVTSSTPGVTPQFLIDGGELPSLAPGS